MKLLRSELESEFKEKLFDINTSNLPDRGIGFSDQYIACTLTSSVVQFGFQVSGRLKAALQYDCDRCLDCFDYHLDLPIELCLTARKELKDNQGSEMILFPYEDDCIDISCDLADLIILARPMKSLCSDQCKGLCNFCGINLNRAFCDCVPAVDTDHWGALKKLKLD
tara:strand:- start:5507 stop:6007 length:501 start_codon:yes stop_codon:yes gene_type:complete